MSRFYLVINVHPETGILGVHADAADTQDAAVLWRFLHNEDQFCNNMLHPEMHALPEPGDKGMYCICGAYQRDADTPWLVDGGPAPTWRRPTAAEMVWLVTGDTPPTIRSWLLADRGPT